MKIAFYKKENGNFLDLAIDTISGHDGYSHCELVFDGNAKNYNYKASWCFSISGRENCSRFKVIDLTSGHWDLYNINDNSIIESIVLKNASNYLNKKYDYLGIFFGWIIPTGWQSQNKWWCSELCSILLFGEKNCRVSPNKLSKHYKLNKDEFSNI